MSENHSVPYVLEYCFLEYKITSDTQCGKQQLLWRKQVTVIWFHRLWLSDRRISHWCSPISTRRLQPSLCAKTALCTDVFILCYSSQHMLTVGPGPSGIPTNSREYGFRKIPVGVQRLLLQGGPKKRGHSNEATLHFPKYLENYWRQVNDFLHTSRQVYA